MALDTVSSEIQGWSYGVHHDTSLLRLESVTFEGTDAARLFKRGFEVTSMDGISECSDDLDPRCTRSTPGGGYIAACVLSNIERVLLPLGRNSLSKAVYRLQDALAGPGPMQATIGITNRLKRLSSPPVAINLTNDGQSRVPRDLIDGWILVSPGNSTFHRGDPNGDGRINVTDAISLFLFLFVFGPAPGCLESADFDDDGRLDTTDPILILRWLFLQGSAPAFPGGPPAPCAADLGGEGVSLGCEAYEAC